MKRKDVLAQDECKHGIWPPSSCTICTGKEIAPVEARIIIVARWRAKFPGKCHTCGDDIEVGQHIAQDTEDRYLCERCSR